MGVILRYQFRRINSYDIDSIWSLIELLKAEGLYMEELS